VASEPLPSLSYSAGTTNKTVPSGGSLALAPDDYGIVTVNSGGTLKLSSGVYNMKELRASSSGIVIEIDLSSGDPVTINVVSNLQLGKEAEIRLLPNGEEDSELVTFNTLQSSLKLLGELWQRSLFVGKLQRAERKSDVGEEHATARLHLRERNFSRARLLVPASRLARLIARPRQFAEIGWR